MPSTPSRPGVAAIVRMNGQDILLIRRGGEEAITLAVRLMPTPLKPLLNLLQAAAADPPVWGALKELPGWTVLKRLPGHPPFETLGRLVAIHDGIVLSVSEEIVARSDTVWMEDDEHRTGA